jgi:[ribosomal protein S5]-alanine N-acetyltransferase
MVSEDAQNLQAPGTVLTERLRLEPITANHAHDLWLVHNDERSLPGTTGWRPTPDEAVERATAMADGWQHLGVHKWMAYHRETDELVGRDGASATPADHDWGRVNDLLPQQPWVRATRSGPEGELVHANWVEIGWALRRKFWGHGYATEIGQAALAYSFDELGMEAVVSCTSHDNHRSRAVMERLGMTYAGHLEALDSGADLTVHSMLRSQRRQT